MKVKKKYIPISQLKIPGKIFEKKINNNRIKVHMEKKDLFNPNLHRFRKVWGRQQTIALMHDTTALSQRKRQQCNIVFVI